MGLSHVQLGSAPALAEGILGSGLDPSPLKLQLQPRVQEIILESKANHDGEDLSNQDLAGAPCTATACRRSS
jgi:hypothetical protein